jgi:hypothetical protein
LSGLVLGHLAKTNSTMINSAEKDFIFVEFLFEKNRNNFLVEIQNAK